MTLDLTAILLEVFAFLENCVKTEFKTLMILEIRLQKKKFQIVMDWYFIVGLIETSEIDCKAPARFSYSSLFYFFFFTVPG